MDCLAVGSFSSSHPLRAPGAAKKRRRPRPGHRIYLRRRRRRRRHKRAEPAPAARRGGRGGLLLCLGQRMVLFKLDQTRVSPDFVLHSIYSGLADDFVKQLSQGSTVAHFNMADIKNIPLFEPPIDEQVKIVEYLSMVLAKYDSLTSSVFRAIELMQERRTALISAAVTGKIDVRHWEQPND